jgi:hypothetical protein
MEFYALTLMDSIIPAIIIPSTWLLASDLHKKRNILGLLSGVVLIGIIYTATFRDPRTFSILQFGILMCYLIFHARYCQLRAKYIKNVWSFVLGTGAVAAFLFVLMHQLWEDKTGLPWYLAILPIHLITFELGAFFKLGGETSGQTNGQ